VDGDEGLVLPHRAPRPAEDALDLALAPAEVERAALPLEAAAEDLATRLAAVLVGAPEDEDARPFAGALVGVRLLEVGLELGAAVAQVVLARGDEGDAGALADVAATGPGHLAALAVGGAVEADAGDRRRARDVVEELDAVGGRAVGVAGEGDRGVDD